MKKFIRCCLLMCSMLCLFACGKQELQKVEPEKWTFSVNVMEDTTLDQNEEKEAKQTQDVKEDVLEGSKKGKTEQSEALPAFSFDEEDITQNAILQYFEELDRYYKPEGSVYIPAYCIFKEELDEADENLIKVYGNFWSFVYSLQGDVLFCESGGEEPGVIYLRKNQDAYVVDHVDAVGDGSMYMEDIERICEGNNNLKKQYLDSGDGSKNPLKAMRLFNIAEYVKKNHLNIVAYQDYGWDPVPLTDAEEWNNKLE